MNHERLLYAMTPLLLIIVAVSACNPQAQQAGLQKTPLPMPSERALFLPGEGKCGDGRCEGPENDHNCPQDCDGSLAGVPSGQDGAACSLPNPQHAIISGELEVWQNWLVDGGLEQGDSEITLSPHPESSYRPGSGKRSSAAAHSGTYGYSVQTGPSEGLTVSVGALSEKGDSIQFNFWARSKNGSQTLDVNATGTGRSLNYVMQDIPDMHTTVNLTADWQQVSLETYIDSYEMVQLDLTIGPDADLSLDDFEIDQHIWKMAEYDQETKVVGGIDVPLAPVAPLHMTVLIHIEDPAKITQDEAYFWGRTAVFTELARVLHEHGGFLTIQPEEDWMLAAQQFAPDVIRNLVRDFGVVFSTHTHGPHCRDDEGRLRSYSDCKDNQDDPAWDQTPSDTENPYVLEYVTSLHDLIQSMSGTMVTDHNGNWGFPEINSLVAIPMKTWSAYKNHYDQHTYDVLINNPWRPTETDADLHIEDFLVHDPDTQIVYIPGYGQNIARYLERIPLKVPRVISQFIKYADAQRVNTFYIVTHEACFVPNDPQDDLDFIRWDPATGKLTYSAEFLQQLGYWDEMLTDTIDPLVAQGYIEWTSLPEMGDLYLDWEQAYCK